MKKSYPTERSFRKPTGIPLWLLISGLLVLSSIAYFGIWKFARWQANQANPSTVEEQIELEFKIQKHLFEIVKTFGSLAFVVTAYYAWRNLQIAEQNWQIAEKNRELAEDKQVAERFSKAVEMLGNKDNFEIHLGGIYSLERIARDSKEDYWTVVEVLAAFIRSHSPIEDVEEQSIISPSVQAALTTLSNLLKLRNPDQEKNLDVNLAHTNLRGAKLYDGNLRYVFLSEANLADAYLNIADLSGARLYKTIMDNANLAGAKLIQADLPQASLVNADVYQADFSKATALSSAQVREANSWEDAIYDQTLQNKLGLSKTKQSSSQE